MYLNNSSRYDRLPFFTLLVLQCVLYMFQVCWSVLWVLLCYSSSMPCVYEDQIYQRNAVQTNHHLSLIFNCSRISKLYRTVCDTQVISKTLSFLVQMIFIVDLVGKEFGNESVGRKMTRLDVLNLPNVTISRLFLLLYYTYKERHGQYKELTLLVRS